MALTLVKEDGTGMADANSYASAADGDAYHDGHLYASAWTAATAPNKEKALVMASRLIDAEYQFNGFKASGGQAMQWPRISCPDPDVNATELIGILWRAGNYVDSNIVPKAVVDATCELARELLVADRTATPPGEGLKYENRRHHADRLRQERPQAGHFARRAGDARKVWRAPGWRERGGETREGMKGKSRILAFGAAETLTALILASAVGETVILSWDPSPSPGIGCYRAYYGIKSRSYAFVTNTGLAVRQVSELPDSGRWFFAVTACGTNGMESAFSSEVSGIQSLSRPRSTVRVSFVSLPLSNGARTW